ncbi:MAG: 50S ribosomal protein L29 [bacterium]|nr:50S ribosomal protein L29 [bacterium]
MNDFKDKSLGELNRLLAEKREALRVFRFEMAGSKVKNIKSGRAVRTAIAQILTEINVSKTK